MHALVDTDILCYEMGAAKDPDTDHPLHWPLVKARVDARIEQILESTKADTWQGYLTGVENFRDKVATIVPYKGPRRNKPRPFWYQGIYNYLRDDRGCIVVDYMEADDALAIAHTEHWYDTAWSWEERELGCVLCSRDKDLRQVPGWHYTWPSWRQEEHHPYFIGELDGLRFYYSQCLTGDSADNIPGLYNVGSKSAAVKRVQEAADELAMFSVVREEYEKRFGSYWKMFLEENGTLLWLKRSPEDSWPQRQRALEEISIIQ